MHLSNFFKSFKEQDNLNQTLPRHHYMGKLKYWQGKVYRLIKYSLRLTHISFTSSCTSRKAINFPCKFTKFLIALSIIQIIEAIMTNTFDDNIFEVFFWMLLEKVQNVCINRVHKTPLPPWFVGLHSYEMLY